MVYQPISNMRIIIGYAKFTNKQYHVLSDNLLAKKWCIGLDKATSIIEFTNREKFIPLIKEITQWYRTDLISQILPRLNIIFYTDTLSSKKESIVRNTCDRIFTDGKFVYTNIM